MRWSLEDFLGRLERLRIHFRLARVREGYVMVEIAVPGERWEVEVGAGGDVEVEVFRSVGGVVGEDALEGLFARFSEAG